MLQFNLRNQKQFRLSPSSAVVMTL